MGRRLRFHTPFSIHHVMLRGNNSQDIFFSDSDRHYMHKLLEESVKKFDHQILAFCFMTNHIHLAIQVQNKTLSQIMQNISYRYVSYMNKKHNRIGHLFQGRFKSIVVDGSKYLNELIRYIHLNPIRANIVKLPEDYIWSSHKSYLMINELSWLTSDTVLKNFGNNKKESLINYEKYVLEGIGIKSDLDFKVGHSEGILGDEKFIQSFFSNLNKINKTKITLDELSDKICHRFNLPKSALQSKRKERLVSHVRSLIAFFGREFTDLSMQEIATFLNRDATSLNKLLTRLDLKKLQFKPFEMELSELREWILNTNLQMPQCRA